MTSSPSGFEDEVCMASGNEPISDGTDVFETPIDDYADQAEAGLRADHNPDAIRLISAAFPGSVVVSEVSIDPEDGSTITFTSITEASTDRSS